MDGISGLADDQMALVMCLGAFFGCGITMSLSYYIGAERKEDAELRILLESQQEQSEESHQKAA